jgi:putative endonuclease
MRGKRGYGELGEEYALRLLIKCGYKILERNFKCKLGEIDIIAIDKDTLVFVEVKTRWNTKYGKPEEAVTLKKLANINRVGQFFCFNKNNLPKKLRIDVVAIEAENNLIKSAKIIKVL